MEAFELSLASVRDDEGDVLAWKVEVGDFASGTFWNPEICLARHGPWCLTAAILEGRAHAGRGLRKGLHSTGPDEDRPAFQKVCGNHVKQSI